jgi:hypothetical protein
MSKPTSNPATTAQDQELERHPHFGDRESRGPRTWDQSVSDGNRAAHAQTLVDERRRARVEPSAHESARCPRKARTSTPVCCAG